MSNHTQGKWHVKENGGKGELVGVASDRSNWFIAEECLDADAQLIAAAPEMLEALKSAEKWLDGWASADPYVGLIREAIAKAEGKQ